MTQSNLYSPSSYDRSRPIYPTELFDGLRALMGQVLPQELQVLDLACGTGLVWNSIATFTQGMPLCFHLIDPDAKLLELALKKMEVASSQNPLLRYEAQVGVAERIPLPDESMDILLVGSAWHWFKPESVQEIHRVLKPGGAVYIFEYQFPKMESDALGLNEWVRRQFNEEWKFTNQSPRGTLREVTQTIRDHDSFSQRRFCELQRTILHTPEQFSEMIFSQARFLDFEKRFQKPLDYRFGVSADVRQRFGNALEGAFLYRFEAFLFQKRRV